MNALQELARAAGLSPYWRDYRGLDHEVSADSLRRILAALGLPADSEEQVRDSRHRLAAEAEPSQPALSIVPARTRTAPGLHSNRGLAARLYADDGAVLDLQLEADGHGQLFLPPLEPGYYRLEAGGHSLRLAVTPAVCHTAAAAGGGERLWGLAAQLYGLRRPGDFGIGDFTALEQLVTAASTQGADALAISPVHALFSADPAHYSPYSPSSRLFLNVLHADPDTVFGCGTTARLVAQLGLEQAAARLEQEPLIDWPAAAAVKLAVMKQLYAESADRLESSDDALAAAYRTFVAAGGAALRSHASFEMLHAAALAQDARLWHWRDWPAGWRDPAGAEVAAYAAAHPRELGLHLFLQWLADRGLGRAQDHARSAGMRIGLIADLAIGTCGGGSRIWSQQDDVLTGLGIGAPPDLLNGHGQDWGLTAFSPRALRQRGYAPFIETLRAALRHAGGLRIDHVLGLGRLWLVPEGGDPADGAYLSYPIDDLLRLVALESRLHQAVIIGEDLGTVPEGFRRRLAEAGVLGIQVLWFERDHGYFVEPSRWSEQALATTTTHDLPTVAGWWQERDLDWRGRLGLFAPGNTESSERGQRARDRRSLWGALVHARAADADIPPSDQPQAAVDGAIGFVGRTPSPLAIVPVEDLFGLAEQPNVPGTRDEHPNWRRRLPRPAEDLLREPAATARLSTLQRSRRS